MSGAPAAPAAGWSGGEWWLHATPFRHFRATNVFSPADYDRLTQAFAKAFVDGRQAGATGKTTNYDAEILGLTRTLASWFDPIFTDPWIAAMHRAMLIGDIHRVDGALHSSPPGSRTGWIHTDYCSAWFDESAPPPSTPIFPDRAACDYFSGKPRRESARPAEYARAATMIYFLANDGWRPGDGGETGLYASARGYGAELVPPINNSLVYFRCSPHSFHRFVTNPGRTRNSIILWVHETVDGAASEWGPGALRRPGS